MHCFTNRDLLHAVTLLFKYYNNRVDVRGHKYVFGPTQTHFSPSAARVKMSSEKGQKHIYAQEHQLYYYYNYQL